MATAKKDTLNANDLAKSYGYVAALINAEPELKALFQRAYTGDKGKTGQWTAQKFQAALQNTKWFKQHSDQFRKVEALKYSDPATYAQSLKASVADVTNIAAQMGYQLSAAQLADIGLMNFQSNYTTSQLRQAIDTYTQSAKVNPEGGQAQQAEMDLKKYAADMGVNQSDDWMMKAERSVAAGLSDPTYWQQQIADMAKSRYQPFAQQIDAGQSVRDIASSYINSMANTLELDPNAINLQDATIQKALTGVVDEKTGQPQVQSLWSFEQGLRQDARWQFTKQANQQAYDVGQSVLQAFGMG